MGILRASLLVAVLLLTSPASAEELKLGQRVGFDGMGDVRIGMSLWDLLSSLERPVALLGVVEGCTFVMGSEERLGPSLRPGLAFMVVDGRLARIDVSERGIATSAGAQVGDREAAVLSAYAGAAEVLEHAYVDGHYLTVRSQDGASALVFETDGSNVQSFRIGRLPEALYVEGCL
jgi:hypothetical protein